MSATNQLPLYKEVKDVPWLDVTAFLEKLSKAPHKQKTACLAHFRKLCIPRNSDVFAMYRLLLPGHDRERGNYALKELRLASVLIQAADILPDSDAATRLKEWKKPSTRGAGNFAEVADIYVLSKHCLPESTDVTKLRALTVGLLNQKLDELAAASSVNKEARSGETAAKVIRFLMQCCTAQMLKWIIRVILREMKNGLTEGRVLKDYHPDAEMRWNMTMDLRRVCEELKDPNKRIPSKEVELFSCVNPQCASPTAGAEDAIRKMGGKPFVVEVKFDGERLQLHRDPTKIAYFSRRGKEHSMGRSFAAMDAVVSAQLVHDKCVLDGELIVWNKTRQAFEPFGTLVGTLNAAVDGAAPDSIVQMESIKNTADPSYTAPTVAEVEVIYLAFDVLYTGEHGSVIHLPLRERLEILRGCVKPWEGEGTLLGNSTAMRGRVLALLPNTKLPLLSDTCYSRTGSSVDDIMTVYNEAIFRQEEGILVKALDSEWRPDNRSLAWLKVKPDYVENELIDAVIVGACYGKGPRSMYLSEWLLALPDPPPTPNSEPSVFFTFCKVGTGMKYEEMKVLFDKLVQGDMLAPPGAGPPPNLRHTKHPMARVDRWVRDPLRSFVLEVKADVRTITSSVFATKYSLRFPTVNEIRYDKSPVFANTTKWLDDQVYNRQNNIAKLVGPLSDVMRGKGRKGRAGAIRPKPMKKPEVQLNAVVPSMRHVDTSHIQVEVDLFNNRLLHFHDPDRPKEELAALVKKLGGRHSEQYIPKGENATVELAGETKRLAPKRQIMDLLAKGRGKAGATKATKAKAADPPSTETASWQKLARLNVCDIYSIDWLYDLREDPQLLTQPRPRHYMHMLPETKARKDATGRRYCDEHGDPYFEELDEEGRDIKAILERHVDQKAFAQLSTLLHKSPHVAAVTGVESLDSLILRVEEEVGQVRGRDPWGSLFRACTVYFLDMSAPATTSAAHTAAVAAATCSEDEVKLEEQTVKTSGATPRPSARHTAASSPAAQHSTASVGHGSMRKAPTSLSMLLDSDDEPDAAMSTPAQQQQQQQSSGEQPHSDALQQMDGKGTACVAEASVGVMELPALLSGVAEAEAAAAEQQLLTRQRRLAQLQLQVEMHGGQCVQQLTPEVTHIILVLPADHCSRTSSAPAAACREALLPDHAASSEDAMAVTPAAVVAAVVAAAKPHVDARGLSTLRRQLQSGTTALVDHSWITDSIASLSAPEGGYLHRPCRHLPIIAGAPYLPASTTLHPSNLSSADSVDGNGLSSLVKDEVEAALATTGCNAAVGDHVGSLSHASLSSVPGILEAQQQAFLAWLSTWSWDEAGVPEDIATMRDEEVQPRIAAGCASAVKGRARAPSKRVRQLQALGDALLDDEAAAPTAKRPRKAPVATAKSAKSKRTRGAKAAAAAALSAIEEEAEDESSEDIIQQLQLVDAQQELSNDGDQQMQVDDAQPTRTARSRRGVAKPRAAATRKSQTQLSRAQLETGKRRGTTKAVIVENDDTEPDDGERDADGLTQTTPASAAPTAQQMNGQVQIDAAIAQAADVHTAKKVEPYGVDASGRQALLPAAAAAAVRKPTSTLAASAKHDVPHAVPPSMLKQNPAPIVPAAAPQRSMLKRLLDSDDDDDYVPTVAPTTALPALPSSNTTTAIAAAPTTAGSAAGLAHQHQSLPPQSAPAHMAMPADLGNATAKKEGGPRTKSRAAMLLEDDDDDDDFVGIALNPAHATAAGVTAAQPTHVAAANRLAAVTPQTQSRQGRTASDGALAAAVLPPVAATHAVLVPRPAVPAAVETKQVPPKLSQYQQLFGNTLLADDEDNDDTPVPAAMAVTAAPVASSGTDAAGGKPKKSLLQQMREEMMGKR